MHTSPAILVHSPSDTPSYNSSPIHASGGAATLSGISGLTSVTALSKSSMTLSPVLFPASLICFSCSSASLLASSSAFLLPLVCYPSSRLDQPLLLAPHYEHGVGRGRCAWGDGKKQTFFSNSLNSSSFCLRYSSISFCASVLASLTRFDRSRVRD